VTKLPMATAFVSFRGGTPSRLCCVFGPCLTSHVVHREPFWGEGPSVSEGSARAPSLRACFSTSKHGGLVSVSVLGPAPNPGGDSMPKCRT
jgi:hypothetical protein